MHNGASDWRFFVRRAVMHPGDTFRRVGCPQRLSDAHLRIGSCRERPVGGRQTAWLGTWRSLPWGDGHVPDGTGRKIGWSLPSERQRPMATSAAPVASRTDYQLPVVRLRVPERVANAAFWLGLAGAVVAGGVELPVAVVVAAGVVVVRHRSTAR